MASRRRVLFLIPNLGVGGAERVFATLLQHIDRTEFEPMLGVVDHAKDHYRAQLPVDIPVFNLRGPRVRNALPHIISLIWRMRPELVISTLDHLNLAIVATRVFWPPRVKCALRMTSVGSLEFPAKRLPFPRLLRRADVLIYQSAAMKEAFERQLPLSGVPSAVLNNPVDIAMVRAKSSDPTVKAEYPSSVFNFVAVGTLAPVKGMDLAIEAIGLMKGGACLTIVGDGAARLELEQLVRSRALEGRVRFAGFQPNPYPFIAQADALVLPSRFEGFPNVILEALALGKRVVAMPVPGVPELVRAVPGCGVASEITAASLAAALDAAVLASGDPPEHIVAQYSAERATKAYEELFRDVTGRI